MGLAMAGLVRFLGDSPLRIAVKLLVVSFLVGVVMATFGWDPLDVVRAIREMASRIWALGFNAIEDFAGYVVLGAGIVVPAFLILRLLSLRKAQ